MAAGEDQAKLIVAYGLCTVSVVDLNFRLLTNSVSEECASKRLAPKTVDPAVSGDAKNPGVRERRNARIAPITKRDHIRVLKRILSDIDVTEDAYELGERRA